jgi:hypothetical protein
MFMAYQRHAANLLIYPHGEWYVTSRAYCEIARIYTKKNRLGNLTPDSIPGVLDAILRRPPIPTNATEPPLSLSHWRGRMGLNKDEQVQLYDSFAQT